MVRITSLAFLSLMLSTSMFPADQAAGQPTAIEAVQVIGIEGTHKNVKGTLQVKDGNLTFTSTKGSHDVPISSIQDVVTGKDSQRVIGGTLGTISMLAPYGGGRALSLLRSKIDTLTIEYRDSNGALHGVIFTTPVGKTQALKDELIAQGAHTSIPSKPDQTVATHPQPEPQEKQ